jgi:hypothetical protein
MLTYAHICSRMLTYAHVCSSHDQRELLKVIKEMVEGGVVFDKNTVRDLLSLCTERSKAESFTSKPIQVTCMTSTKSTCCTCFTSTQSGPRPRALQASPFKLLAWLVQKVLAVLALLLHRAVQGRELYTQARSGYLHY